MHRSKARFKVLDCGRRWGKTRLGVMECYVAAHGRRAWWVAPSYKMSEVGWRPMRRLAAQIPGATIHRATGKSSYLAAVKCPCAAPITLTAWRRRPGLRGAGRVRAHGPGGMV